MARALFSCKLTYAISLVAVTYSGSRSAANEVVMVFPLMIVPSAGLGKSTFCVANSALDAPTVAASRINVVAVSAGTLLDTAMIETEPLGSTE